MTPPLVPSRGINAARRDGCLRRHVVTAAVSGRPPSAALAWSGYPAGDRRRLLLTNCGGSPLGTAVAATSDAHAHPEVVPRPLLDTGMLQQRMPVEALMRYA